MGLNHLKLLLSEWANLGHFLDAKRPVIVDGRTLSLAAVVAVALYDAKPVLSTDRGHLEAIDESVHLLDSEIASGRPVYGVNTGFGGSADTRTKDIEGLQSVLLQLVNVGVLLPSDKGIASPDELGLGVQTWRGHALPVAVVKGMMLVRCNSLMRGHSGVRIDVIQSILTLLQEGATPVVPLRGSISASGELVPLSYIAGVLEGNPDVYVRLGSPPSQTTMTADKALSHLGLERLRFGPKEALGITNGTATSTCAASIALYQAHQLAVLTQVLTAMATEALLGTALSFAPFISEARPHAGQREVAANIFAFLSWPGFAAVSQLPLAFELVQDRYALRTAPQWIGPVLEQLVLAHKQVQNEINSTTDNPLIDVKQRATYSGGNFQAAAMTSAMELKTSSMQMLAKLVFSQCSELLNSALNKGLPPNLSSDDPSKSFAMKGLDITMAAYMAELAQLIQPVSSHMQNAEMNNQAVNSMALVAARIALEAVEVLSPMAATHIYILCQALDLRCLHLEFEKAAEPAIKAAARDCFGLVIEAHHLDAACSATLLTLIRKWPALAHVDLAERCSLTARESAGELLDVLARFSPRLELCQAETLAAVASFRSRAAEALHDAYADSRAAFFEKPSTPQHLGAASRAVYGFVRNQLKVPMHRGLADHPTLARGGGIERPRTIGTMTSEIYLALRNGKLYDTVLEMAEAADALA